MMNHVHKMGEKETICSNLEIHAGGLITVKLESHLGKDIRDPETHTAVKERSAKKKKTPRHSWSALRIRLKPQ